jgi:Holliday junction resolvase RusA-like endonuclease
MFIPGNPQGKGRARSFVRNGKVGHYTPEETRTYEGLIRTQAVEAMKGRAPSKRPIAMRITIIHAVTDSWQPWKKKAATYGYLGATLKPDSDNVEKAVKDALNGVAWADDCQVIDDSKVKVFDERPGVKVEVFELDAAPANIKKKADLNQFLESIG